MKKKKRKSLFPPSIFFTFLIVLLLMSGIHTGVLVLMEKLEWNSTVQTIIPIAYWALIAIGLTLFTRARVQKTYDIPMQRLAEATRQVAEGDFSVYVPPLHEKENADYLDTMIEDFNKMVAELGSIETLKTDFFTNVSHEIKTPLSVIQSNAELLCGEKLDDNCRRTYAANITQSTHRLSSLITNMLKLNKLEKQAILPKPEKYDLCVQLGDCAVQFEEIWDKKGIEFEADMEDSAVITSDKNLLELVWNNLLSNAVKFTPDGGKVILREWSETDGIRVSVSDTGCGMSAETKKRIFDKFYQGDTSHATEGNGLGLSLVLRVLQLLDYSITVESEEQKGSVFTVTIPPSAVVGNHVTE